jgi:DNA recombination protein RmuC
MVPGTPFAEERRPGGALWLAALVTIVALLIGLVVGAVGVLLLVRPRLREAQAERLEARALAEEARLLERRAVEAEALLQAERGSLDERVANSVRAASTEALQQSSTAFLDLAQTKLDAYVAPLRESLGKVERQVGALESARREAYGALTESVRQLRSDQERLRTETGNLVTALRAPHVRGRWGEIQLRRVIEMAGMLQHCDFEEQVSTADDEGRVLRPDVVVRLPGGKSVVIDSKVPLAAYLDAFAEHRTEDERRASLADHARHVREHIQRLGQKTYWRQLPATPEFVVMFLPDETFLRAALEQDASLVELAVANNVIPASPTNLIGLLRAVHYGWQQETIAESARQVSDLGRELYKRLSTMGAHVARLGKSLDGAVKAYNETVGSLETRVLPQARAFERHGITGIEAPELTPIDRQARALVAPELVGDERPALETLPTDAHAA